LEIGYKEKDGFKPAPGNAGSMLAEIMSGEGFYHLDENPNLTTEELTQKIYNQVIKDNKLNIIRSEDVISEEKERLLDNVLDTISKWNEETIDNFINTRVKPYNKLIETTKPQKKIKEVKGAKLNRPVKNPVLC